MEVVTIILTVLQVIASLVLIAVIMFQSGKESGLSGVLTGKNDTYLSKMGGLDKKLASITKWIALVWGGLTLLICIFNAI